jgi:hypothetical protein
VFKQNCGIDEIDGSGEGETTEEHDKTLKRLSE